MDFPLLSFFKIKHTIQAMESKDHQPITPTPPNSSSKKPSVSSPRQNRTKTQKQSSTTEKKAALTRDAMSIPQLQRLESQFAAGELTEQEFVRRFQQVIPDLTEPQLVELFLKIDANADGQVSWDEVTSYMFVHASDQDDISHSGDADQDHAAKEKFVARSHLHHRFNDPSARYHRSPVVRIVYLEAGRGTYLTASLDGTVHQWDAATFTHKGCLIRRETAIQDIVLLPMSKKLVVAESHSTISFHDCNSGSEYTRVSGPRLHQCTPSSIDVCWDEVARKEMLIVGDDTGSVHIFGLKFKAWQIKDTVVGPHQTHVQKFEHVDRGYMKNLHNEWISKIQFVEDLNSVVSSSMDGTVKVSDLYGMLRGEASCIKHVFDSHKCGVTDFAWSDISRMMISCGVERGPLVWNPFSKTAVTQLDAGHASITTVTVDERRQRIISVDAANHIHVHSLKNYKPLQNLHQRVEQPAGLGISGATSEGTPGDADSTRLSDMLRIGAIFFHDAPVGGSLITATQHLHKWPLSADITRGERGPDTERAPIGNVLYNRSFHQLATAELDDQSSVCIWDPSTGSMCARFANAHEGSAVTAMTFDSGQRRLITGSHDGSELRVWNFGNRRLLSRLVKLPHHVVQSRTGSIEDTVEEYTRANRMKMLEGENTYNELTDLTITAAGNMSLLRSTISSSLGDSINPTLTSSFFNSNTLNGSTRMRESTIPPPQSAKVVGSILHQSLKQPYKTRSRSQRNKVEMKESISTRKRPRADRDNETNSEVTKILFVEANTGSGLHIQHFIVTAGWDRQVYVFDDDDNSGRQEKGSLILGYLFAIPRPEQMFVQHTADITDLAYCDPSLTSCSLDGFVKFWSMQNGEHIGSYEIGTPVHKLVPINSYNVVVAASECSLHLISTVSPYLMKHVIDLNELCGTGTITTLEVSSSEAHLVVGDESGYVHVLRIGESSLDVVNSWKAHRDRVLNTAVVENPEVLDIFVITTSQRAEVFMWTLDGAMVGNYGNQQHSPWDLGQRSTYKGKSVTQVASDGAVQSATIMLIPAKITIRHLPKVGEVWVRTDHTLTSHEEGDSVNSNSVGKTSSKHFGNHSHILTVQRVGHDSVVGWDGNYAQEAKLRHCPLAEFNPKASHSWHLESTLSKVIGCVYFDNSPTDDPFKVVCVCQQESPSTQSSQSKYTIVVRDHALRVRSFPVAENTAAQGGINSVITRRSLSEAMQDRQRMKTVKKQTETPVQINGATIKGTPAEMPSAEKSPAATNTSLKAEAVRPASSTTVEEMIKEAANERENERTNETTTPQPITQVNMGVIEEPDNPMVGWVTTSYVKYGKLSKRSPKPSRHKFRRLWETRLDARRTYNPSTNIPTSVPRMKGTKRKKKGKGVIK